jgi:hypothetical protein
MMILYIIAIACIPMLIFVFCAIYQDYKNRKKIIDRIKKRKRTVKLIGDTK